MYSHIMIRNQFRYFLIIFATTWPSLALACPADRTDEQVGVSKVHDGDTLLLEDGRKLRLLAIDTPELAREEQPAEPLADKARIYLQKLISNSPKITLRHDTEKLDRYKRTLSHAFLTDGRNISALLLEAGLATSMILPPNVWAADCYSQKEQLARRSKRGLWSLKSHQLIPLSQLSAVEQSTYAVVAGTIDSITGRSKSTRILLSNPPNKLTLFIKANERELFDELFKQLKPKQNIEVQGWINNKAGDLHLYLRHPSALRITEPTPQLK